MSVIPAELILEGLSLLPLHFQAVARDAASGYGEALSCVYDIIDDGRDLQARLLFLPVLYAVLDRARIPTTEALDTKFLSTAGAVARAFTAIMALHAMNKVPPHLLVHFWPLGDRWMVEAVKAGLLPALVSVIQRERAPRAATRILEVALPSYVAHYRVVAQVEISMSAAMPAIQRLVKAQKVPDCLTTFLNSLSHSLKIRSNYDSGKYVSTQACDNMKCGALLRKSRFRRCSQCSRPYYCSEQCQTVDWCEAGHRAVCESLFVSKLDVASTRDRAFMRAFLHHIYESSKHAFKCVPPSFGVYPIVSTVRAEVGGRMEIHLVDVPDDTHEDVSNGTDGRSRIFPLRSARSDIYTGLRAIANALPSDANENALEKEIEEGVKALLRKTQDGYRSIASESQK
ncbi:hypothetical protein C8R44DRAFT_991828 [Mycena epipterygia]|nr:hypothetical protein C8R44DRAFT_991828 [Mycena epipterygia]